MPQDLESATDVDPQNPEGPGIRVSSTPPSSTPPQPAPEPKADEGGYHGMVGELFKVYSQIEKQSAQAQAQMAPLREKMMSYLSTPPPQIPQLQSQLPPPPDFQKQAQNNMKARFMYAAVAIPLAFLAGRGNKFALAGALTGFGRGMDDMVAGQQQEAKEKLADWRLLTQSIEEMNQQRMELYRAILENKKLSMENQFKAIEFASEQLMQPVLNAQAKAKNLEGVIDHLTKIEKAQTEFKKANQAVAKNMFSKEYTLFLETQPRDADPDSDLMHKKFAKWLPEYMKTIGRQPVEGPGGQEPNVGEEGDESFLLGPGQASPEEMDKFWNLGPSGR
jgi:hypothetical protein